jgi:serine acetyltransferase
MAFIFLHETIKTYKDRGLAEFSTLKVVLCYLGVHKIFFIKLSHAFRMNDLFLRDRSASHISRWLTEAKLKPRDKIERTPLWNGAAIAEPSEMG